jgi:hypothetical protein
MGYSSVISAISCLMIHTSTSNKMCDCVCFYHFVFLSLYNNYYVILCNIGRNGTRLNTSFTRHELSENNFRAAANFRIYNVRK